VSIFEFMLIPASLVIGLAFTRLRDGLCLAVDGSSWIAFGSKRGPRSWERPGSLRARVVPRKRRSRLADTLISRCCIDHDVRRVT